MSFKYFALMFLFIIAVSYATAISSCTNINTPGYYELTNNLVNPNPSSEIQCINITVSDVQLNLSGHEIRDNYSINVTGLSNISIYNGGLNSSSHLYFSYDVENILIDNLSLEGSSGIFFQNVNNSFVGFPVVFNKSNISFKNIKDTSLEITLFNSTLEAENMSNVLLRDFDLWYGSVAKVKNIVNASNVIYMGISFFNNSTFITGNITNSTLNNVEIFNSAFIGENLVNVTFISPHLFDESVVKFLNLSNVVFKYPYSFGNSSITTENITNSTFYSFNLMGNSTLKTSDLSDIIFNNTYVFDSTIITENITNSTFEEFYLFNSTLNVSNTTNILFKDTYLFDNSSIGTPNDVIYDFNNVSFLILRLYDSQILLFNTTITNFTIKDAYYSNSSVILFNTSYFEISQVTSEKNSIPYSANTSRFGEIYEVLMSDSQSINLGNVVDVRLYNVSGNGSDTMIEFDVREGFSTNLSIYNIEGRDFTYGIACAGTFSFFGPSPYIDGLLLENISLSNISREGYIALGCGKANATLSNITFYNISEIGFLQIGDMEENITYKDWYLRMEDRDPSISANMGFHLETSPNNVTFQNMLIERGNGYGMFIKHGLLQGNESFKNITIQDTNTGIFIDYAQGNQSISFENINYYNLTYGLALLDFYANTSLKNIFFDSNISIIADVFYTPGPHMLSFIASNITINRSLGLYYANGVGNLSMEMRAPNAVYSTNSSLQIYNTTLLGGTGIGIQVENGELNLSNVYILSYNTSINANISNSFWRNVEGKDFFINGTDIIGENITWNNVKMCSVYSEDGFIIVNSNNISGNVIGHVINESSDYILRISPCVPVKRKNYPPSIEIYSPKNTTYNNTTIFFSIYGEDRETSWLSCEYTLNNTHGNFDLHTWENFTKTLNEGDYHFEVICDDGQGKYDNDEVFFSVKLPHIDIINNTTLPLNNNTTIVNNTSINYTVYHITPSINNTTIDINNTTIPTTNKTLKPIKENPPKKVSKKTIKKQEPKTQSLILVLGSVAILGGVLLLYRPTRTIILSLLHSLILLLLLRVARVKILDKSIKVTTLWGSPIKNHPIFIKGQPYKTNGQGYVPISEPVSKREIKVKGYLVI